MKVILNKDLASLGEEGDVKDVARGYARNFLFPRGYALAYTPAAIKILESRRAEIENRKEQKRRDAMGIKEKLESIELNIAMPAGPNGRLYGAVTSQTVCDELAKQGFQIERKRIELLGTGFKSVGKYKAAVKLYENQSVDVVVNITPVEIKTETPAAKPQRRDRKRDSRSGETAVENAVENAASDQTSQEAAQPAADEQAENAETESAAQQAALTAES